MEEYLDRKFRGKKLRSKSMSYLEKFKIENFIVSVTHFNESRKFILI